MCVLVKFHICRAQGGMVRMRENEMKGDLKLVAVVAVVAALFGRTALWGVFSWAISTPFHETGHAAAAWLTSRTALPTPFKAIIFSEQREIWFFLLQLAGCAWIWKIGRDEEDGRGLLVGLAWVWSVLLVFCSFVLGVQAREQFMIWAGQGGELLLAAAAISLGLAYGSDLPWVYGTTKFARQHKVLLFWGAVVFAGSPSRWFLCLRNPTLVPFGAFGEEPDAGDLDRLKDDFNWTVPGMIKSYLFVALLSLVAIATVAALNWEKREAKRVPIPMPFPPSRRPA
jgi:hypothetical protein